MDAPNHIWLMLSLRLYNFPPKDVALSYDEKLY